MKIFIFLPLLLLTNLIFSQECDDFLEGVFRLDIGSGNMTVERKGIFQLEKSQDFGTVYLQKIEPISKCEYLLKRYKVIIIGGLPMPNMTEIIKVVIYKTEKNIFFYHAKMIGTNQIMDGKFIKVSANISSEFKEIIDKEQ